MPQPYASSSPTHSFNPNYQDNTKKPSATVSTKITYDNVYTLSQTPQLIAMLTYVSISHIIGFFLLNMNLVISENMRSF